MQTDTDEGVHLALLLHELADHRLGLTHLGHCEGAHLFRVAVCTLEHTHAVARGGRWGLSTACMPVRTSSAAIMLDACFVWREECVYV
jgi:hypothetical protein